MICGFVPGLFEQRIVTVDGQEHAMQLCFRTPRVCRVGRQRVASMGTFPTVPSFDQRVAQKFETHFWCAFPGAVKWDSRHNAPWMGSDEEPHLSLADPSERLEQRGAAVPPEASLFEWKRLLKNTPTRTCPGLSTKPGATPRFRQCGPAGRA
jgi:hypothetical protein